MTTRQTSIDIYNKIKAEGLLSGLRFDVYNILFECGPLTQKEAFRGIQVRYGSKRQLRSYTPRFSELEKMGAIHIVNTRKCMQTGNDSTVWDVTTELPRPLPKQTKAECVGICWDCGHIEKLEKNTSDRHQRPDGFWCYFPMEKYKKCGK